MSKTADEMRRNAENCAELAQHSNRSADKARYKRMERAWSDLADTQEWLDGTKGSVRRSPHAMSEKT
jgi:hypothetical protein